MNEDLYYRIGQIFTPETPINTQDLFSGREQQIKMMRRAVTSQGAHSIIYGERGVGKTSLGNLIKDLIPKDGSVPFATFSCLANTDFNELWYGILSGLFVTIQQQATGYPPETTITRRPLAAYIQDKENVTGQEVRFVLQQLNMPSIILIDEVDRLDDETTTALADTIKMLSDYNVRTTVILIGVGDSVAQIIKAHASIVRALIQI